MNEDGKGVPSAAGAKPGCGCSSKGTNPSVAPASAVGDKVGGCCGGSHDHGGHSDHARHKHHAGGNASVRAILSAG